MKSKPAGNPLSQLKANYLQERQSADCQEKLKYMTDPKFFDPVAHNKNFKDRTSIVYRDFCFTNQLRKMDKDPLSIPTNPEVLMDP